MVTSVEVCYVESDLGYSVAYVQCGDCRYLCLSWKCDSILIRAFELTGLCCGQPGASNFVMQRLCLQDQVAVPREVHDDG